MTEGDPVRDEPGLAERFAARLVGVYFVIDNMPFPLDGIPYLDRWVAMPYKAAWDRVLPAIGRRVFGLEVQLGISGSGDRAYYYVQTACFLAIAVVVAAAWATLDRRRHPALARWTRFYIRFALAGAMISYGIVKVIKTQFPDPSPARLVEPLGDFSPMGLLWTFMGFSRGYSAFTGAAEMLGGLLLTTRRTALLGALLSAGVMLNVFVLNMCYDVPVKLYSAHLLAMALFLIAPDAGRLARFFLLSRAPGPAADDRLFTRRALDVAGVALRTLAVAWTVGSGLYAADAMYRQMVLAPRSPLHGAWDVEEFELGGERLPPLLTEGRRWRRVVISDYGAFAVLGIQPMTGAATRARAEIDAKQIRSTPGESSPFAFAYERDGADRLRLSGEIKGKRFVARLRKLDAKDFPLLNRGFHWISEQPFNR
jgi:hypothetical protein